MTSGIIAKAADIVESFLDHFNFTNDHYHYRIGGERYLPGY